jgi:putative DNA primase/helicase
MTASNYSDVLGQLLDAGLLIPPAEGLRINTHRPVKCLVQDGGREKRGWYWLKEWSPSIDRLLIVGSFGIWRGTANNAQKVALPKDDTNRITPEQRAAMKRVWADAAKAAEQQRKQEAAAAASMAVKAWGKLSPEGDSPYLLQKGVAGYGVKYTPNNCAVIPLVDTGGKIHGLQFLRTASQARQGKRPAKEFWPTGTAKTGHFHLLGHQPHWIVLVAEGYATAAALHAATGYPVACAFDAGNLGPVADALRKRYKRAKVLICADDDAFTEGNPGVTAASAAAMAVAGEWIRPQFADEEGRQERHAANGHKDTDFNDLQRLEGAAAVAAQVSARLSDLRWSPPALRAVPSSDTGAGGERLRPLQYLDDLLGRYALVYGAGGAVFDRSEHCLLAITDMRNACIRVDLHKAWMEHPDRDIVRQDEVGFDPACSDPKVTCNLWGGWPTQPKAGKCTLLLELLHYMCSGERNARQLYDWVLKWVAYPIQHPGAKMKTTIVVHGPQGTGKNLFFETIMSIYGKYGRILDQDALTDKHNDWASRKLFLIADEVVAQAHRFEVKNKLKTLITGTWVRINPKHIAAYDEANHVNLVFLSNESMPVVLEEDDRRHCIIWTPPKKPEDFYRALLAEISEGGVEALHEYLLHLDLGDFNPGTLPPETAAKRELIDLAQDSPVEFVDALMLGDIPHLLSSGEHDDDGGLAIPGLVTDWYVAYGRWCSTVGVKPASMKRFVSALDKRRSIRSGVRKRYLLPVENSIAGEKYGPHAVYLFGQTAPEGDDEAAWLGRQIKALRNRLADQRRGDLS